MFSTVSTENAQNNFAELLPRPRYAWAAAHSSRENAPCLSQTSLEFLRSGEITSGAFRSWGEHSSIVYRLLVARTGKSSAVGPDPDKNGVRGDEWASLPRTGLLGRTRSTAGMAFTEHLRAC